MVRFCTGELPDYRSLQCFLSNEETGIVGISHCYFFRFLFNLERLEKRQGCSSIFVMIRLDSPPLLILFLIRTFITLKLSESPVKYYKLNSFLKFTAKLSLWFLIIENWHFSLSSVFYIILLLIQYKLYNFKMIRGEYLF